MNVFVLTTGRTGSMAFVSACQFITNYSASHESLVDQLGEARLAYPTNHIEADNRLCWLLGRLNNKYGTNAFYVHLTRDRSAVAESYNKRWDYPDGIVSSYTKGILMSPKAEGIEYCFDMVDTIEANIALFLKDKPHQITIHLESIQSDFEKFWYRINAQGNLHDALKSFDTPQNISKKTPFWKTLRHIGLFLNKK